MLDGCADTGPGSEGNTAVAHRKLDASESLQHHGFIQPAKVTDTENLSGDLSKAGTKRHTIGMIGGADDVIGIRPGSTTMAVTVSE